MKRAVQFESIDAYTKDVEKTIHSTKQTKKKKKTDYNFTTIATLINHVYQQQARQKQILLTQIKLNEPLFILC